MTIKVEREALLRVISRAPSVPLSSSCWPFISTDKNEDEFVIVELPNKHDNFFCDDLIPESTDAQDHDDDDIASLCTLSTDSVSSYSNDTINDNDRRVTFATDLVTDVWTREKTLPEDVPRLYYSALETQAFRQEYRLERKVLSELSIDPETFAVDEDDLSNLVASSTPSIGNGRHCISRVVVLHNDKLETFFNNPCAEAVSEAVPENKSEDYSDEESSNFFDNESFWSGSLTWY